MYVSLRHDYEVNQTAVYVILGYDRVPAVRYQDLYRSCIQEAYALLSQSREISRLLGPIRRATTLYPYDESLHILYISCLFQLQRYKEAVAEYDRVVNLLFDDPHTL